MGEHLLFVYGTLRDPRVQRALFGRAPEASPADLDGWALYCSAADGYLFIKPNPAGMVRGEMLRLPAQDLAIADYWEETPTLYAREVVVIRTSLGDTRAWTYTRRRGDGQPHLGSSFSAHDSSRVVLEASRARKQWLSNE